jgi:beta-glucosidase-like glycosyl hydrolase
MNARKIARLIHPEFRFGVTKPDQALRLVELGVGGFCFYGGDSAREVFETVRTLKAAADTPLIISADYEKGAGHWIKDATELPPNMAIGASGSEALARRKGEITADEARAAGVDWILAPVVDMAVNPRNPIVNLRAYGDSPGLVSALAASYISGLHSRNAVSCLKHFPGHGATSVDSHLVLPVLERTLEDLEGSELMPFRSLLAHADSVMVGHLKVPALDPDDAASFSRGIITGLLRNSLRYDGCVITDALNMKAIADEGAAGVKALRAGADILLAPGNAFKLYETLCRAVNSGTLSAAALEKALARQEVLAARISSGSLETRDLSLVGCAEHHSFVKEMAPACLAWAFQNGPYSLRAGETVGYLEPCTRREDWKGAAFMEELGRLGVRVKPFESGGSDRMIIGSFSQPRAFSGDINLSRDAAAEIDGALKGGEALMAAFGSPFVFADFHERLCAGLCAFSGLADFQRAAAAVLTGAVKAGGSMPVDLKLKARG